MRIVSKIKIPNHWTPEQANAVVEFLSDIEMVIRKEYQARILEHQLYELNHPTMNNSKKEKWEGTNF